MNRRKIKSFVALHAVLMVYSLSGICSKLAAEERFMSKSFIVLYGMLIVLLGIYAVCWQQILKWIPLTTAFSNKAVTVIWGLVWGVLFFHEHVTMGKVVGILLVAFGIVVYALSDKEEAHE